MTLELTRQQITDLETGGVLTHRQAEILHLRLRGFSQNQIAAGLHISRSAVRYLEDRARQKIHIHKEHAA